jgi:hypothetical protein
LQRRTIKNEVLISYAINEACAQQENALLNTEWSGQSKLSFLLPKAKLLRRYLEHRATAAKIGTFASVVTTPAGDFAKFKQQHADWRWLDYL